MIDQLRRSTATSTREVEAFGASSFISSPELDSGLALRGSMLFEEEGGGAGEEADEGEDAGEEADGDFLAFIGDPLPRIRP